MFVNQPSRYWFGLSVLWLIGSLMVAGLCLIGTAQGAVGIHQTRSMLSAPDLIVESITLEPFRQPAQRAAG